jgi:hypothetical protein
MGWVLAVGAALQAACVYPIMTDEVAIAASATALPPAERSIMYLGGNQDRYRLIEPEIPDLDWSTWRANYSPPGAVAVAPGNWSFRGGRFYGYCKFTAPMAAGHSYRPALFACRYHPEYAQAGLVGQCLRDNPGAHCCATLTETTPDGGQTEIALPCSPPPG